MENSSLQEPINDNQWQALSAPVFKETEETEKIESHEEKKRHRHPVLTFQIVAVLCVLLFLFTLKFLSIDVFDIVMNKYSELMSESLIYSGNSDNRNLVLSTATTDEVSD